MGLSYNYDHFDGEPTFFDPRAHEPQMDVAPSCYISGMGLDFTGWGGDAEPAVSQREECQPLI